MSTLIVFVIWYKKSNFAVPPGPTDLWTALDSISVIKEIQKKGVAFKNNQIIFGLTTDDKGIIVANPRKTISFNFTRSDSPPELLNENTTSLTLLAVVDTDSSCRFFVNLSFSDEHANISQEGLLDINDLESPKIKKVSVGLSRVQDQPFSLRTRTEVAKLWSLVGENLNAGYHPSQFESIVLGTNLSKDQSMGVFVNSGNGEWTLIRIYQPSEAFIALNLRQNKGEIFPKNNRESGEVGKHLLRLF